MSLYALADQMAAKGRNGDSVLVHMTPGEVQGLQALAMAGGGSLTINPETGLPEANFLKKLLPAIAGFALGPAGFGLFSSSLGAAAAVGGVEALRTGSLSRGLVAGLGAYGGSSLGMGLTGAGAGAAQQAAIAGLGEGATQEAINQAAADATKNFLASEGATAPLGVMERLGQSASAAVKDPSAFLAGMGGGSKALSAGLMAAVPATMAEKSVSTKTQMPGDTGYIRQFTFDPYTQQYTPVGVYPANEYGKGPAQGMADGGIVALANGGFTDAQVAAYIRDQGLSGGEIAKAAQAFGISSDQLGRAQGLLSAGAPAVQEASQAYAAQVADRPDLVAQNLAFYDPNAASRAVSQWVQDNPSATREQIDAAMQASGASAQDVAEAAKRAGLSAATTWSALNNPQGLAGMNAMIRDAAAQAVATPGYTAQQAQGPMQLYGITEDDVMRATGMTLEQLLARQQLKPTMPTVNVPQTTTTNLPVTPTGPGGTYTKEDINKGWWGGTGEPVVGVKEWDPTGRIQRPIPGNIEQHEAWYNRLTGGSKEAYDYLTGKGAYPTKPYSASGAVFRPYGEVVLGQPASSFNTPVIFDPVTRSYKPNPNYKPQAPVKSGSSTAGTTAAGPTSAMDPRSMFDEAAYLAANPDVAEEIKSGKATFGDAYGHFLRYGLAEGRPGGVKDLNAFRAALTEWERAQQAAMSGASSGENFGGISSADAAAASGANAGAVGGGGFGAAAGEAGAEGGFGGPGGVGGWAHGGKVKRMALGGLGALAAGGAASHLGDYSDGGRLLKGPGDGVSDSIPATIGDRRPARLADGEFVIPARIVSEIGNGSTDAGARKLYAMMDRVQRARGKTTGKGKVAKDTGAEKYLPA